MPSRSSVPKRRRRKEITRARLNDQLLELFVAKGFAATRLEEVATLAGVSKGTLYLYFDSKEALFQAVIREGILPIVDSAEAFAAGHTGSAFELLKAILLGWWERIGTTRLSGIPRLMVAEAQNFPDVALFYYQNVIRRG
ncbi:MAG TPA: TetR/AcrR family transcriptional regulator, partial [Rhodocyclaceae bacterium]|nr:TetR/AcrR family transcriptional regulator [Rhodocyclaceae bacterium]